MLEIRLKEECDNWLRKVVQEISTLPEELAHISVVKFTNEYRLRKAVRGCAAGEMSLGKPRRLLECPGENSWR